MDEQAKKIVLAYRESIKNYQEALKVANVPDPLVELYLINIPDFNKLLTEDVISLFKDIQILTVLYLNFRTFSLREIAKRIGCSHSHVQQILNKYKEQSDKAAVEEVQKKEDLSV